MSIEVELANELIRELNRIIDDLLEIPADVFEDVGLSAVAVAMYEDASKLPEFGNVDQELNQARQDFQKLCDAAPNVDVSAVRAVSLAYGAVTLCFRDLPENQSPESVLRSVMAASKIAGMAIGLISASPSTHEAKRKQALSIAGRMGAAVRHQKPGELKRWALAQADRLHGADADIARSLAGRLPIELADVSKNPERLIYDALREAKRPPDSKPAVTGD